MQQQLFPVQMVSVPQMEHGWFTRGMHLEEDRRIQRKCGSRFWNITCMGGWMRDAGATDVNVQLKGNELVPLPIAKPLGMHAQQAAQQQQ